MYYDDHSPPHFHAYYGEYEAIFSIATIEMMEGQLPKRAKALIAEWALEHRLELIEDWELAAQHQPLKKIEPLE